jgi:hypothetical protein
MSSGGIVIGSLTTALTTLAATPGGLNMFHRMTSSQQMQAAMIIENMEIAGPTSAGAFVPQLLALNLPPQVTSQVNDAIMAGATDPSFFKSELSAAKTSLLSVATGGLAGIFG